MTTLVPTVSQKLQEWAQIHAPASSTPAADAYWGHIVFVRDIIPKILSITFEEGEKIEESIMVISEHSSKSICLPVFQIELADGTQFTMRYNFHNWILSVSSLHPVEANFMGLFNPSKEIHPFYCEGFPKELVFDSYTRNNCQFTFELRSGFYHIFMFFWIFAHQVLGK
jgi:hypothetical protein